MRIAKGLRACPITGKENAIEYFNLGNLPLVNNLCYSRHESLTCSRYPLAVQYFPDSELSTLTHVINPDILYTNYTYKSGVSYPYIEHCEEMFQFLNIYLQLKAGDSVLDIGGNDGTLLKTFLSLKPGLDVLNIDASKNLTDLAIKNGVQSLNVFWNSDTASKVNRRFKLIVTTNCFQHTEPIESFVEGISVSLEKFGIWCLEFPYWKTSLETNQFDQVYHEHVYYYTLRPLVKLFEKYNLRIIKAVKYPIHGGTMRLLVTHIGEVGKALQPCSYSIPAILETEKIGLEEYLRWGKDIKLHIQRSRDFILDLKKKGKRIAGFGAAAKGCIYLNAMEITDEHIDYVVDDTNLKQGKYIPGTGIKVVDRSALKVQPPDYVLILAHNFAEYIIKSLALEIKAKFIILLPRIKVIDLN